MRISGESKFAALKSQRIFAEDFVTPSHKGGNFSSVVCCDTLEVVDGGYQLLGNAVFLALRFQQYLEEIDDWAFALVGSGPGFRLGKFRFR